MIGADTWITSALWRNPFTAWRWRDVRRVPKRYLIHKYERWTQGVSRYDGVNANSFIADAIAASVYKLFAHTVSYPNGTTYDEWLETLLELRDLWTADEDDIDWVPSWRAWSLLRKTFPDLWS